MTEKAPSALRTIGEVAEDVGVATHVLRFWESKFEQITPQKRRGRRYYRPEDIRTITQIKALLYGHGYTIKGVQKFLASEAVIKPAKNQNIAPANEEKKPQKSNINTDLFGNPLDNEGKIKPAQNENNKFDKEDVAKLKEIHKGLLRARKRLKDVA